MRYSLVLVVGMLLLFTYSCKKNIDTPVKPEEPKVKTETQMLNDSIYYYYKLYSYWEQSIPSYKSDSKLVTGKLSPNEVLDSLKKLTPYFSGYGKSIDRFSFFNELSGFSALSAELKMDTDDGYGLYFSMGTTDGKVAYPTIYLVEGGSPADKVGLQRSDRVLTLNSEDMQVDIDCSSGDCVAKDAVKYKAIIASLNSSLSRNKMNIKVQKANNELKTFELSFKTYEIDPLIADTVLEFSDKNVGYFAYSSFEEIKANNFNQVQVDKMFDKFKAKNIKALIVDLRYNGGGYVDAATYIADKIITANGKGKKMLEYDLNAYLSRGKNASNSSFKDVYFKKTSDLELETVCFIVSNKTASASEMLINVLRPYMNVKIIAEQSKTYGKPVGFFEQKIMNKIGLWVTSFKLLNANGDSDYWLGIEADKKNVADYIFVNFGDKEEKMIAAALSYTGVVESSPLKAVQKTAKSAGNLMSKMDVVNEVSFKGALKRNYN